jgi:hypothetical protein
MERHIRQSEHEGLLEHVQKLLDDPARNFGSALPLAAALGFTYSGCDQFAPAAKRGW